MGIFTTTPRRTTLNDAVQDLLNSQFFQRITHHNGYVFAESLAKWLIQYTLVTESMKEALDLELILYTLHGKNIQKSIAVTDNCIQNTTRKTPNSQDNIN